MATPVDELEDLHVDCFLAEQELGDALKSGDLPLIDAKVEALAGLVGALRARHDELLRSGRHVALNPLRTGRAFGAVQKVWC